MYVPAHLQEIAKQLGLRSWVARKGFPREIYFETIDLLKANFARHSAAEPRDEVLAGCLAYTIDHEGVLLTHVLEAGTYKLSEGDGDPDRRWLKVCQAAAWVVLQAYAKACKDGEWPVD
jgi:hypothetical protein